MTDIVERCKNYIANGGLSNPEHSRFLYGDMLVMDCRDEIERLREALRALVIAVEYKGPPVDFGEGNLCWEARVPLAFVDNARAALGEGK
jgi:hypothetical protein